MADVVEPGTTRVLPATAVVTALVQQWCRTHAAKVSACFLTAYEDAPAVFVIGSGQGYDYSLSQPLADLEMELHRRGWHGNVLQLLAGDRQLQRAFVHEAEAVQVHPEAVQTHHANR